MFSRFLIFAVFQVAASLTIRYEGSSVWTIITPSSLKQIDVIRTLQASNTGVFFGPPSKTNDDVFLNSLSDNVFKTFKELKMIVPSYLEQDTLRTLRSNEIIVEQFPSINPYRGFNNYTRKYVVSSGKLLLNINIRNFKYEIPGETTLAELYEPVDLIDKITVPNNSPATVIVSLSESQTMTQTWEMSFTKSLTGLIGGNLNINLPNMGGGGLSASVQLEFSSTQTVTQSIERNYGIARQVAIPPFTTIQAHGYVNWLNDIQLPFEVIGQVYLDRSNGTVQDVWLIYCEDGAATTQCSQSCAKNVCPNDCVGNNTCECCYLAITDELAGLPNVMRDYLISQGMQAEVIGTSGNFLLLRLHGTFTASLGTDIVFNVTEIVNNGSKKPAELGVKLPLEAVD